MKWTKKEPTKPGFYWYTDSMCEGEPVVVKVEKEKGKVMGYGGYR